MKITDGIFAYEWRGYFENNCNSFYFGEPFNILFDPGLANYVDMLLENMKKDGIKPEQIRRVVNTHCHPDHLEGSEYFMKKGLPVAMLREEIDFLNTEGPMFFEMFGMPFPDYRFDTVLEEGTWKVDGGELEVIKSPGHSPGSACFYWKEKKALVCGDVIFNQSVGRVDFPGGSGAQLIESIKRLSQLDVEILLPGHMDILADRGHVRKNFELIERFYFGMME